MNKNKGENWESDRTAFVTDYEYNGGRVSKCMLREVLDTCEEWHTLNDFESLITNLHNREEFGSYGKQLMSVLIQNTMPVLNLRFENYSNILNKIYFFAGDYILILKSISSKAYIEQTYAIDAIYKLNEQTIDKLEITGTRQNVTFEMIKTIIEKEMTDEQIRIHKI
jgi:hypothetical protein